MSLAATPSLSSPHDETNMPWFCVGVSSIPRGSFVEHVDAAVRIRSE